MKKNVLKSTILLSATVLSMATVSVFADDELVPTIEATEVVDNGDNATENLATDIIEPSNDISESQSEKTEEESSIETAVPSVPSSAVTVQVPTTLADESPSFESAALSSALFALSSAVCDAELSFLLDE